MNSLHETQRKFAAFIHSGFDAPTEGIVANGIATKRRLAIYRNNTMLGLTEALRGVYPMLEKLLGEAFFRRLCRAFIADRPPRKASLIAYGGDLADFLESWPAVADLPYLGDIARLEWYEHELYHEADEAALRLSDLGTVRARRYGDIRLGLKASVRLLASRYPLDKIRRLCLEESAVEDDVDLKAGGCRLLLCRPEWYVEVVSLGEGGYRFFTQLAQGETVQKATEEACCADLAFNLSEALRLAFDKALFAHFTLA